MYFVYFDSTHNVRLAFSVFIILKLFLRLKKDKLLQFPLKETQKAQKLKYRIVQRFEKDVASVQEVGFISESSCNPPFRF